MNSPGKMVIYKGCVHTGLHAMFNTSSSTSFAYKGCIQKYHEFSKACIKIQYHPIGHILTR